MVTYEVFYSMYAVIKVLKQVFYFTFKFYIEIKSYLQYAISATFTI